LNELISLKGSYPPSLVFGKSKFTSELIKEYEEAGFFPSGDGRPPSEEETPSPETNEIVVFREFFICVLRFPCDTLLPSILEKFSVKIHQLTPNSFLELSKFFGIMKTFKCIAGADVFARLFELVIEKDILKLSDGNFYEPDYACCTFNTRRKNLFQNITRIQPAPCSKTNLPTDWHSYWFYLKVDMSKIPSYTGLAYLLYSLMAPMTAITTAAFNDGLLVSRIVKMLSFLPARFLVDVMLLSNLLQLEFGPCHMIGNLWILCFLTWIGLPRRCHFRDSTYDLRMVKALTISFFKLKRGSLKWLVNLL
jgi:hypothetical protein